MDGSPQRGCTSPVTSTCASPPFDLLTADFGSGPPVTDRLNQGPFPQYPPDALIPTDDVVMTTTPSEEVVPNFGKGLVTYITADSGTEEIKADNIPQAIEHSVEFQAGLLRFMQANDFVRVETRPEEVAAWTQTVIAAAEPLLSSKVDSWQTGVNRNVEGRSVRRVLGYNGNGVHFRRKTDEVARGGYREFVFGR